MIAQAIKNLRPGAEWMLDGDTLGGLVFLGASARLEPPTQAEVDAEIARLRALEVIASEEAAIKRQLADIDAKSIRPMAEADAAYLQTLRAPVAGLRDRLRALATARGA